MMQQFRFPLFIDLHGKRAVVVGGGKIALRRVAVLKSFGAEITMIAPECKNIPDGISYHSRPYETGDLHDAFLAVAATDDREVNRKVGCDAARDHIFVSVADSREESTFFFPAVCTGNGLVSGVVSDGTDHGKTARAAKKIRKLLEETE